ncbi:isoprenyl transferase [Acetobacterium wieringae]|jgi:undecaprenyl diphosphate synthase|uniref:Isoprenyl transferase n=1 Tax=Acetobacterium wieringae TaxID=52694 RepID=A0A5D0WPC1_9FIRM|nr:MULTISPECIES: isoprenyl transferase [Acetobacterium]HAZ06341.1 isoprenyl transferase [Acetobacterium sp.]MEA4804443.1 isoprenyl transferase [Acetobacterium wieringae]OXS25140.1 MAG: di-trans,poly-cis-decaprenylcistransferase [Acetobacterium sp. MES1]TYC85886.1 isoprenyl transferase [Acetobacterium wieringae]UYO63771.1 isoprenyl transferase [Acetobacterium wieringae]
MTSQLNSDNLPEHIAIIMDGNGRWAKAKNRPRLFGHNAGMKTLKKIVRASSDAGIKIITMYAFSTENWKRSPEEVDGLMNIAVEYFHKEVGELHQNNVKINVIGNVNGLAKKVREAAVKAMSTTAENTGLVLNIALNYGGRDEILHAVKALIAQGIDPEAVTEQHISDQLYTKGQPDPDLLIRTGGESRLSNFMLWQMAYSEFMFTDVYWPDFEVDVYYEMIKNYQKRNRRYGSAE